VSTGHPDPVDSLLVMTGDGCFLRFLTPTTSGRFLYLSVCLSVYEQYYAYNSEFVDESG